jgi:transcription-repair coupling factor (superfamily II helicase)
VAALRRGETRDWSDVWVPRLALDLEARVPEGYIVEELERVDLYWRLAQLETDEQVEAFARDVTKRYGPPPLQLQQLLKLVRIRSLCQAAGISELVAGPKGAVLTARGRHGLDRRCVDEISRAVGPARLKRDGRLAVRAAWTEPEARLAGGELVCRLAHQGGERASRPAKRTRRAAN